MNATTTLRFHAPAVPAAHYTGVLRFIKGVALFAAAPFIGLVYAVALPFVGLGALAWIAVRAVRGR